VTRLLALAMAIVLTGCANAPHLDMCKYASVRRSVYTTTIRAADLYAMSGRPVPYEVTLGRQAAATALAVLDTNCPEMTP
jgi:hypothetical protein